MFLGKGGRAWDIPYIALSFYFLYVIFSLGCELCYEDANSPHVSAESLPIVHEVLD